MSSPKLTDVERSRLMAFWAWSTDPITENGFEKVVMAVELLLADRLRDQRRVVGVTLGDVQPGQAAVASFEISGPWASALRLANDNLATAKANLEKAREALADAEDRLARLESGPRGGQA